jgi:hypothetical protein
LSAAETSATRILPEARLEFLKTKSAEIIRNIKSIGAIIISKNKYFFFFFALNAYRRYSQTASPV